MKTVFISDLAKECKCSSREIIKIMILNKLRVISVYDDNKGITRDGINFNDAVTVKEEYTNVLVCPECNKTFMKTKKHIKYCSDFCRNKHNGRKSRNKTCKNKIIENGSYKGSNRSFAIKEGRKNSKKILNCSVDCLLKEFGDIE